MSNPSRFISTMLLLSACLLTTDAVAKPTILDGNEHSARTEFADTTFYDNEFPILNVRNVSGNAIVVEGPEIEDLFSSTTSATEVVVTMQPPSGEGIIVATMSGPTWYEDTAGNWAATFPMPDPGDELIGTISVTLDGSSGDGDDDDDPNKPIIIIGRDGP